VEAIDSAGTRTCFHRPTACRLLHHGEGSHFGVRDGNDCSGRPTSTIALQDKSGAAHPGRGAHWRIVLHSVKTTSSSEARLASKDDCKGLQVLTGRVDLQKDL